MNSMKDVTEKTGETSNKNDQITADDPKLSVVVQENAAEYSLRDWVKLRIEELNGYCVEEKAGSDEARIQRVPAALRSDKNLDKYFEPRAVAVGPYQFRSYFWDDLNYQHKAKLAAMFIKEHVVVNKETLYLKIKMEIENLRKFYKQDDETVREYDDDELAWMFQIDGCSVLRHIYFTAYDQMQHKHADVYHHIDHSEFTRDLIKMENQIPYRVLELLINLCDQRQVMRKSVQLFINKITHMDGREEDEKLLLLGKPLHLLDLMRTSFIQSVRKPKESSFAEQILEKSGLLLDILQRLVGMILNILPRLVHDILLSKENDKLSFHPSFYSVEILKAAGIKFRPSSTRNLTDITFSSGTLKLPPIFVDQLTATILMNMAAYEMTATSSVSPRSEVSSYIFFLASLIGQPQDVKELRDNGIIYNNLESDEEVVKLFKEMSMVPVISGQHSNILSEIQRHCEKRYNVWIAQLKYRYFESPWSMFAFLGAVIALCLTFVQTVYAILGYRKDDTTAISNRNLPST